MVEREIRSEDKGMVSFLQFVTVFSRFVMRRGKYGLFRGWLRVAFSCNSFIVIRGCVDGFM